MAEPDFLASLLSPYRKSAGSVPTSLADISGFQFNTPTPDSLPMPGGDVTGVDVGTLGGPLMTRNGVTMITPAMQSLLQMRSQLGLPVLANVVSSYRTREQQAALYQSYLNGTGNLAAPPGQSNHETGHAVDISSNWLSQNPQVRQWLLAHGWTNDVSGEPWHWEYGT
jgi:hypothetical protein